MRNIVFLTGKINIVFETISYLINPLSFKTGAETLLFILQINSACVSLQD